MGWTATETISGEHALWSARGGPGGDAARHRLFAHHADFARSLARRHFRSRSRGDLEFADLYQMACTGLLEAIDRYDPDRGVAFRAYAAHRIAGSIANGIAHSSEVREQHSARARLGRQRIRSLANAEPAGQTANAAFEQLAEIALGLALGLMLEGTNLYVDETETGGARAPSRTAYEGAVWEELVSRLRSELAALPARERDILQRHYLDGIGFEVLADLHRISRGRVSQLHREALMALRKKLARHGQFSIQR